MAMIRNRYNQIPHPVAGYIYSVSRKKGYWVVFCALTKYYLAVPSRFFFFFFFFFFHSSYFSWAGLYDGRFDNATIKQLVLNDNKFAKVRANVKKM